MAYGPLRIDASRDARIADVTARLRHVCTLPRDEFRALVERIVDLDLKYDRIEARYTPVLGVTPV